jgi:hypothetical protein
VEPRRGAHPDPLRRAAPTIAACLTPASHVSVCFFVGDPSSSATFENAKTKGPRRVPPSPPP